MTELDELDRKIIRQVCSGVYSYKELGEICDVGRNTIYRRINRLLDEDFLKKKIMATPNYDKLDYSPVILGIDVEAEDKNGAVDILEDLPKVKFLWPTYGAHEIVAVIICDKETVGKCVDKVKTQLSESGIKPREIEVSAGISWRKVNLTPP